MSADGTLWLENHEMTKHLHVSPRTLLRLRTQGLLQEGKHFTRKNPQCGISPILWNVRQVERALYRRL